MPIKVAPVPSTATDVAKFLDYLQSREKNALGFLPFRALEQAIELGRVLLCFENDDPAGYVIHGPTKATTKIYQTVVCDDLRRVEHGTALVSAVTMRANAAGAEAISLHCAEDLAANSFWDALGFEFKGQRCRRKDRRRSQNRYEIILPGHAIAEQKRAAEREEAARIVKEQGLSNLQRLLLKSDARHAEVTLRRKVTRESQIVI